MNDVYELIEHGDNGWAIRCIDEDIEFIVNNIKFNEHGDEVTAKIDYTITSDNEPKNKEDFEILVGEIVNNLLEDAVEQENHKNK